MSILKIKVVDTAGQALPHQAVKVTGCDGLQTNAAGMAQFLLDATSAEIDINGVCVWAGDASTLAREEVFMQSAAGFSRQVS